MTKKNTPKSPSGKVITRSQFCSTLLMGALAGTWTQSLSATPAATPSSAPKDEFKAPPLTYSEDYELITIKSSVDGALQKAYGLPSKSSKPTPLIVSLHTWGGDYAQYEPISEQIREQGFNFIHPDFRGKNKTPESCASPLALQDIDDAIDYCLTHWNVAPDQIIVIGTSGGGHATCATYFHSRHPIKAFYAWASITDVEAWFYQCKNRILSHVGYAGYVQNILDILGGQMDAEGARKRSSLYMPRPPSRQTKLHLFAGIHDGYTGSVPVSHSLFLFNRLCEESNDSESMIDPRETIDLVTKLAKPTGTRIEDRDVYLHRETKLGSVTVFEGGHEMLVNHCMDEICREVKPGAAKATPSHS